MTRKVRSPEASRGGPATSGRSRVIARAFTLCVLVALACVESARADVRVLVAGDDWARGLVQFGSLQAAFREIGIANVEVAGAATTVDGSTALQWRSTGSRRRLARELAKYPSVDVVHLSLGAFDVLSDAENLPRMSVPERKARFDGVAGDILRVISHLVGLRPNLRIVLAGYDYVNVLEKASGALVSSDPPNGDSWARQQALNWTFLQLEEMARMVRDSRPQVEYVSLLGTLQYAFGYPALRIAPATVPVSQGYVFLPSPPHAMQDTLHPTPGGFNSLARRSAARFYAQYFREHP